VSGILLATDPPIALRIAAYQLLLLDRVPPYAAVDDAVSAAREIGGAKLAGFANAVLRKVHKQREPELPAAGRERVVAEYSLPRWIVDELAAVVPEGELEQRAAAFTQPPPLVARTNRRRITRDMLIEHLAAAGVTAKALDAAPQALVLEGLGDPSRSPSFLAGLWTVQDAGAQLVGHVAAPRAGQRVLDACAGVGGKSTHLAELADDAATIDAADRSPTKLGLLDETARRLGITSIRTHACDLLDPTAPLGDNYDLIVLDAPCSGLGVLRRHPDAKWRLQPTDVSRLASVQAQLIDAVLPRLAPDGALVYSVCTFTRAEGPLQVAALVARSELRITAEVHMWPPVSDAFYIARLER